MTDMSPRELARRITLISAKPLVTDGYERALRARGLFNAEEVWYKSQKEHWLGWLAEYDGPGGYNRKNWRGRSAEFVYNHLGNPVMLLWLAEVAGVPKAKLLSARRAAFSVRLHRASHCAVLRKIIPWQVVEDRLKTKVARNAQV